MAYRELAFCGAQVRRNFYELQAPATRPRRSPARRAGRAWRTTRGAFRRLRPGQPFHEQAPSAAYGAGMAGLGSVRGAPEARKPPAPPAMAAETSAPLQLELGNLTSIVISPSFPARPSPRGASVVSVPRPRHA